MRVTRRTLLAFACTLAPAISAGPAFAATAVIKVSLWDKGAMSMNMLGKEPMMGMSMAKGGAGPMGIRSRRARSGRAR